MHRWLPGGDCSCVDEFDGERPDKTIHWTGITKFPSVFVMSFQCILDTMPEMNRNFGERCPHVRPNPIRESFHGTFGTSRKSRRGTKNLIFHFYIDYLYFILESR